MQLILNILPSGLYTAVPTGWVHTQHTINYKRKGRAAACQSKCVFYINNCVLKIFTITLFKRKILYVSIFHAWLSKETSAYWHCWRTQYPATVGAISDHVQTTHWFSPSRTQAQHERKQKSLHNVRRTPLAASGCQWKPVEFHSPV
jgi:hypothetical protein